MKFTYIKGIDGLRALAVLAVMLFHLNPSWLPGGFTGVDIFFVISGYVVSASLARYDTDRFLHFALSFYARRMVRIFPALIAFLVIMTVLSTLFIPASWLSMSNEKTGLYAFFGISNFALVLFNDGYFSPRVDFNPFTHTWSLGVEEQFYLLFPLVFFLWLKYKDSEGIAKWLVNSLLAALFLFSLAYAWYETSNNPNYAFYLLPSRFWELAAGALLFKLHRQDKLIPRSLLLSYASLIIGIILVVLGFIFADDKVFPFPWALLPVSGAFFLILGVLDSHPEQRPPVRGIFENSLMVYIGKISYSLYLWHWGIYVLFRWTVGLETPLELSLALILTFVFAMLSYHYIETPTRKHRFNQSKKDGRIVLASLLAIVCGFGLSYGVFKQQSLISLSVTKDKATWYPHSWPASDTSHTPKHFAGRQVFVLGDSHAGAYSTMLQKLTDEQGVKVYNHSVGCWYLDLIQPHLESCKARYDSSLASMKAIAKPGDIILLASLRLARLSDQWTVFGYTDEQLLAHSVSKGRMALQRQAINEALVELKKLEDMSFQVIIDAPKPIFKAPNFRCSDWFNQSNPSCAPGVEISRELLLRYRQPAMDALAELQAHFPNLIVWDPFPILCDNPTCSAYDEQGKPLFFDADHLSAHGNRVLYPDFLALLQRYWQQQAQQSLFFSSEGNAQTYLKQGWAAPESWGVWSQSKTAKLKIQLPFVPARDMKLILKAQAFINEKHPQQHVDVWVNRQHIARIDYTQKINLSSRAIHLPKNLILANNGDLNIEFKLPDAKSPAKLGISADIRQLGLGLHSLELIH